MKKLFFNGMAAYFALRGLDILVGSVILLPWPPFFIVLFFVTAVLCWLTAFKKVPGRNLFYITTAMAIIAVASSGIGLFALGGWSAGLRGLSVAVLSLIFTAGSITFMHIEDFGSTIKERMDTYDDEH